MKTNYPRLGFGVRCALLMSALSALAILPEILPGSRALSGMNGQDPGGRTKTTPTPKLKSSKTSPKKPAPATAAKRSRPKSSGPSGNQTSNATDAALVAPLKIRARKGDTIAKIAAAHNVSADDLARLNGIAPGAELKPGQEIRLPVLSPTSSRRSADNQLAFWETIKVSTDPEDFREYLKKYPNGEFAALARNRLKNLEAAKLETATESSGTPPQPPKSSTIDEDPLLTPPDTRNLKDADPKSKSTDEPAYARVFSAKEVDQKARVLETPKPLYTEEARKNVVGGTVVLRAVLTGTGEVTNIRVISGLPWGLTEQAIAAARKLKFVPAMKDGHPVSQEIRLEYNFSPY